MGRELARVAQQLDCSERTLRRYASEGVLRGRRLGPHRLELAEGEQRYLQSHWTLLHDLKRALRTERGVALAALFGSAAVGDDRADSDVDLLVGSRDAQVTSPLALQARLSEALGRQVHVVLLSQVEDAPSLLASILREGRVLVDRGGVWGTLLARSSKLARAAETEEGARLARARQVLDAASARVA